VEDFVYCNLAKIGGRCSSPTPKLADERSSDRKQIEPGTICTEDYGLRGTDKVWLPDAVGAVAWVQVHAFASIADQNIRITGGRDALADSFKDRETYLIGYG